MKKIIQNCKYLTIFVHKVGIERLSIVIEPAYLNTISVMC